MAIVGLISDTHGLLRDEALAQLAGVDRILHAGDIGGPEILDALSQIAPVTAVRGNNDREAWARDIAVSELLQLEGRLIYLVHDIADLDVDPAAADIAAVVAGHSHKPLIREHGGVLYVNPGSAGPRRFNLPISIAKLHIDARSVRAELIELPAASPGARKKKRRSS